MTSDLDTAAALYRHANVLHDLKRFDEALASYDRALAIQPDYVEALINRGLALQDMRRFAEALASYDRALAIKPDFAEVLGNRGNTLQAMQCYQEALTSCDKALAIKPDYVDGLNNRGNALQSLNRHQEALASYDRALALEPGFAEAWNNRANALKGLQRPDEALTSYEQALALQPGFAEAWNNRGAILQQLKHFDEAAQSFERALLLSPDIEWAKGMHLHAKTHSCDWTGYAEKRADIVNDVCSEKSVSAPFVFISISDSAEEQLLCAQQWVREKFPRSPVPLWNGERYGHKRIRVAYLSADLRDHPVAYLLAGLFEQHDRTHFEVFALSFGPDIPGEMRSRLKNAFEHFIDVHDKNDLEIATLMRELEIDIAIDLMGFTQDSRTGILAHRPAPVQVNYLGYPGTMGADYIDYIIADRFVIPEQSLPYYSEQIAWLPDTFQPNDSKRRIAESAPTRADSGLPEHGFVFCSFNNHYKITPPVFDIWMRLLQQINGSVLWLPEGTPVAMRNLRNGAEKRGVAADRIIFAPRVPLLEDHLARYRLADLFLDTLPYNAHTTASDALWAGLPLLTCAGTSFAGRVAGSLLHATGLPELVTHSLADYEARAFELATTPELLTEIRTKLENNRLTAPLFDTSRFRQHIEAAYTRMWQHQQRGEPPKNFLVKSIE